MYVGKVVARGAGVIFGERVLSNFITNIMAAIIDFDGSGRLGREINLYQGGGRRSKLRRGVGVGE